MADPEKAELFDYQWRQALGEPTRVSFFDGKQGDPEPLRRALAEARAAAAGAGDWRPDVAVTRPMASLRAGNWLTLKGPVLGTTPDPGEIAHDGRIAYLFEDGARQSPLDGSLPVVVRADTRAVSPNPDRTAYVDCAGRDRSELRSLDGRLLHAFPTLGFLPYGFDPRWPIAWTGHRMTVYWHLARDGWVAMMSPEAHDWPCGHAKKLFGNEDNEPRWVHVAPRADAYLSAFQRDVLISAAVPMYWEERDGIAVARRPAPDPLRALLFTSDEEQRGVWNATLTEEDARADAPAVVLGTDDAVRYAVDFGRETFRLRGQALEHLSPRLGGYAVYDADHRVVRVGQGRLLGGWDGVATVQYEDQLYREELATGTRRSLGPIDRQITRAIPIAGTENVLLLVEEDRPVGSSEATTHLRLV
jgi:hypothetical protein